MATRKSLADCEGEVLVTFIDRYSAVEISEAAEILRCRYTATIGTVQGEMIHVVDGREVSDHQLLQLAEQEKRIHVRLHS